MSVCATFPLTSGISATWMSVCLAARGTPAPRAGAPRAHLGFQHFEHFLSSVLDCGVFAFPAGRLLTCSLEIRISVCLQAVCPLNRVACFAGRRFWAAVQLSDNLAKYRQELSGYSAVSFFRGLVMLLSDAAWAPGTLSPCSGVCPCDCAKTEQCLCFSGGGLFGGDVSET